MNEHEDNHEKGETHPPVSQKRLFRSRNDRIIAGVCGGIAEFYGISSLGVRIVFILLTLLNGIGLLLYLVGVFLIPDAQQKQAPRNVQDTAKEFVSDVQRGAEDLASKLGAPGDNKDIFKTILIVMVAIVLLQVVLPTYLIWIAPELMLIIAVILIAAYLIYRK